MTLNEARANLMIAADTLRETLSLMQRIADELEMPEGWLANCNGEDPTWPEVSISGCAYDLIDSLQEQIGELERDAAYGTEELAAVRAERRGSQ